MTYPDRLATVRANLDALHLLNAESVELSPGVTVTNPARFLDAHLQTCDNEALPVSIRALYLERLETFCAAVEWEMRRAA